MGVKSYNDTSVYKGGWNNDGSWLFAGSRLMAREGNNTQTRSDRFNDQRCGQQAQSAPRVEARLAPSVCQARGGCGGTSCSKPPLTFLSRGRSNAVYWRLVVLVPRPLPTTRRRWSANVWLTWCRQLMKGQRCRCCCTRTDFWQWHRTYRTLNHMTADPCTWTWLCV